MSFEEHEEIPWSMLVDHERKTRSRFWYAVAALALVVVVGVAGIRWFEGRRHGEPAVARPEPAATTTAPMATTVTAASLATEAGLVMEDPGGAMAAVATAEWFVTDYFTLDGAPSADLAALFTIDADVPEVPAQAAGTPLSIVEWARASATRPYPGGFVVTVLFRTLHRSTEGSILRGKVRAVDVVVLVEGETTAVAELPLPIEVPRHSISGWMRTEDPAPPGAEDQARDRASVLGSDPLVAASGADGGEWRVVLTIADPSGARFPVVVRSEIGE